MTAVVTPLQTDGARLGPVRSRRRRLTFDRVSFMAVFLGVPLVISIKSRSFSTPPSRVLNGLPSGPFMVPKPTCSSSPSVA